MFYGTLNLFDPFHLFLINVIFVKHRINFLEDYEKKRVGFFGIDAPEMINIKLLRAPQFKKVIDVVGIAS